MDRKRRPASQDQVIILQSRISWLENFIITLQHSDDTERDALLRSISLTPPQQQGDQREISSVADVASVNDVILQPGSDGALSCHGPTSIYRACSLDTDHKDDEVSLLGPEPFPNVGYVLDHFGIDVDSSIVTDSLMLFFKWQYPHLAFVYRDAFLRDHFGDRMNSKYWSTALLLSICALGALLLPGGTGRITSAQFYDAAESIALVTGLIRPSITTVQVFLCLAFYEIGRGNPSKGWAYSGHYSRSPVCVSSCR